MYSQGPAPRARGAAGTLSAVSDRSSAPPENRPCPKNVTYKALGASRGIWAASGSPPGVPTVRRSRRGRWSDVILAHTHQYSTQPASACHTFSKKSPPREKNHPPGLARDWSIFVRPRIRLRTGVASSGGTGMVPANGMPPGPARVRAGLYVHTRT